LSGDRVISADKMMNKAKGPVWHKKQKDKKASSPKGSGVLTVRPPGASPMPMVGFTVMEPFPLLPINTLFWVVLCG